jgi:RNA-directed DNA polymerase
MQESHGKGPASHPDPESCVDGRKAGGEALTGAHAGQPSSCEIMRSGAPTLLSEAEGHTTTGDSGEPQVGPAQSKTLSMRGNSSHGNREVPLPPTSAGAVGRPEKASSRTSGMHGSGKSDGCVVPEKPSNKGTTPAEAGEGRRPTEGNMVQRPASPTQSGTGASCRLDRVRMAARQDRGAKFTALLHHVTVDHLRDSFYALRRNAAPGVDGMTWDQYEVDLETHLVDLHRRVHTGTYRAQPSKRAYIPKPDGRQRPLGIAALEDKIVQQAVVWVLNAIYEQDFLGFSYGFRIGRGAHDALDALWVGLMRKKVNWVLDADIQDFFGTVNHGWLYKFIKHRIADRRIHRLIQKWLRAGVSEDGQWSKTDVGVPQGAVASPLLANVYLHYVFDLWVRQWRTKFASGELIVVRYADDFIVGFQHRREAERFLRELRERLLKFGLALHPDKTRLLEFGRFAAENRQKRGQGKPETFDFLGFTHVSGVTHKTRKFHVRRLSVKKRLRTKLLGVKQTLFRHRHRPISEQGTWLRAVVQGWLNYHAVPGNIAALETFRRESVRCWLHALRRRGQRHRLRWERFGDFADGWLPTPKILHPHPNERFDAKHPK